MAGRYVNVLTGCLFVLIVLLLALCQYLVWFKESPVRRYLLRRREEAGEISSTITASSEELSYISISEATIGMVQTTTQLTPPPTPWIFAITPTYKRLTQVVDLTSLCQTLQLVRNLTWIVIEDGYLKSKVVTQLLKRCQVNSVHLRARNISEWDSPAGRGVAQRNAGLTWIRENCYLYNDCNGSFYFMDDDNKYALQLFQKMRKIKFIGIWPVGYAGYLHFEGPVCVKNEIAEWNALFAPQRRFPLDMAGFAVNVKLLLEYPKALFGYNPHSRTKAEGGWQETRFLENFASGKDDPRVECMGSSTEVFVWHIKTQIGLKDEPLKDSLSSWKYDLEI